MYEHEVSKSVPKNNSNKISNSPPWDCYILIPHFSPKKRTRQERDEVKKPLENGFKNFSKRRRQEFNDYYTTTCEENKNDCTHCKNSSSDDDTFLPQLTRVPKQRTPIRDESSELRDSILIGDEYQASIPKLLTKEEKERDLANSRLSGTLVWSPSQASSKQVGEYLSFCKNLVGCHLEIDKALSILHKHKYNYEKSKYYVKKHPDEVKNSLAFWSEEEKQMVNLGFKMFGPKAVTKIGHMVKTKTYGEFINYYFLNLKKNVFPTQPAPDTTLKICINGEEEEESDSSSTCSGSSDDEYNRYQEYLENFENLDRLSPVSSSNMGNFDDFYIPIDSTFRRDTTNNHSNMDFINDFFSNK